MSEINAKRRLLLGTAAAGIAAAEFGFMNAARAASAPAAQQPELAPLRQIDAGVLNIGYYEAGPVDGPVVILLHGFPYDIHSYVDVAPMLAARGNRVIVPHLRGHGTTRFLDSGAVRTAQQSAVAQDVIALMDALKIERAVLAGYDWGARTACVAAVLWPERCKGIVSVNGYLVQDVARAAVPIPAKIEAGLWYQYYFATERGRAGLIANRRDIARVIWSYNSPSWRFDDATFNRSMASLDNPDYVDIVINNYRFRLGLLPGLPQYEALERRLAALPAITVPAITLDGQADGVVPANDGKAYAAKFSGPRTHRIVANAGHNLPQEAPEAFADAVLALLKAGR
jgi:pimeloyl-ACP methyl ester carboxylesterase